MRVLLRLLAPLFGLAVAAAGALFALEVAWAWARPNNAPLLVPWPDWRTALESVTWADTPVLLVAAAAVLVGLLLLLIATSSRRKDLTLREPAPDVTVTTSPRALARLVDHRVRAADGVRSASVNVTRRKIRVRAASRLHGESELTPSLTTEVRDLVSSLPLARAPRVQVVVDSRKDHR